MFEHDETAGTGKLSGRRILVTGGSGSPVRTCSGGLLNEGHEVLVVDNFYSGARSISPRY